MELPLDDETLQRLYAWIDEIPLSRPKKNIARDFSDGILLAEVIAYYFPKIVQMHNYSPANSVKQKQYNWNTLNRKVLKRLHVYLTKDDIDDLVSCRAGAVEHLLVKVQLKATIQALQSDAAEKDQTITDLRETIQILELKVQKLEQLVRLKDGKIQTLVAKLRSQKP
ncbi:hypothetical protein ATCC90586_004689 [Pythium insidiosum]|nr:hypothetical protein ATCC90586_004689 [Pythium insidiosum]